jgi:hypothetical protein
MDPGSADPEPTKRIHHQWADAIALVIAGRFNRRHPLQFPIRLEEQVWRSANELPPTSPRHSRYRDDYDRDLAGEAVRHTLGDLGQCFIAAVGEFVEAD